MNSVSLGMIINYVRSDAGFFISVQQQSILPLGKALSDAPGPGLDE